MTENSNLADDGLDRGDGGLGVSSAPPESNRPKVAPPSQSNAAMDAQESRRQQITRDLITKQDLKPEERAALDKELAQIVAKQSSPEDTAEFASAPISEQRSYFDLTPPDLPKGMLEIYETEYSGHESMLLVEARQLGLKSDVVRQLRDDGIKLGMQVDGKPLDEAVLDRTLARYGTRLSDTQRKNLKAYWRRIEGGGSA